jgi:hypothetical protein
MRPDPAEKCFTKGPADAKIIFREKSQPCFPPGGGKPNVQKEEAT